MAFLAPESRWRRGVIATIINVVIVATFRSLAMPLSVRCNYDWKSVEADLNGSLDGAWLSFVLHVPAWSNDTNDVIIMNWKSKPGRSVGQSALKFNG